MYNFIFTSCSESVHFRSYGRYSYDGPDHSNRFSSSSGTPHSRLKPDPRGKRLYSPLASHHSNSRSPHHHASYNRADSTNLSNEGSVDEEIPAKRPCLSVDVSRRATDPPTSADSVASSNHVGDSPPTVAKVGVLCCYFPTNPYSSLGEVNSLLQFS